MAMISRTTPAMSHNMSFPSFLGLAAPARIPAAGPRNPALAGEEEWAGPGSSTSGDTQTQGTSAGALFGVPGIANFIDHGYNVLTWDPRGFGQSGGTVEIDDPRYEVRDVQALIDWVAKQPEAQLDRSCS